METIRCYLSSMTSTSMSNAFVINYFNSVAPNLNLWECTAARICAYVDAFLRFQGDCFLPPTTTLIGSSWHPVTDTWFIHILCPILTFPASWIKCTHAGVQACGCFPKMAREEETTDMQTEESWRWLHFNRKTNREGASVVVGVTATGQTETGWRRRRWGEEDADKQECDWPECADGEGRERKSETEEENDRERLLDGGEWSPVETETNLDQQRFTGRERGTKW